jgi:hypothetical protein
LVALFGTLSDSSCAIDLLNARNRKFNSDGIKLRALIKVVVLPEPATAETTALPCPVVIKL